MATAAPPVTNPLRVGPRLARTPQPGALVIFGGTGDLGASGNRLFYLATPPSAYAPIIASIKDHRLVAPAGHSRVVVEKPFGHDLASAITLSEQLHGVFAEDDIFRIDHYLGKETVQN